MKSTRKAAIIGGTGAEVLPPGAQSTARVVETEYGCVDVIETDRVVFLPRHGSAYVAPHNINARANIRALEQLGVTHILATAASGSLVDWLAPGQLVLLSDFVDFTRGRVSTFDSDGPPAYTDMSLPYHPQVREAIREAAAELHESLYPEAVYACTQGPRFETRAEIHAYRQLGCHLVGMTQIPEVVLAAEAGIPYATLAIVTNFAAGMQQAVSEDEVRAMMAERGETALGILILAATRLTDS